MKTVLQEVETCPLNTQFFIDTNLDHIFMNHLCYHQECHVRHQAGKQSVKKENLEDIYNSDTIFFIWHYLPYYHCNYISRYKYIYTF